LKPECSQPLKGRRASEAWDIGEIGVVGAGLRRIRQRDGGDKIPVKIWQVGKVGASRAL
jgi:hypothetical protein